MKRKIYYIKQVNKYNVNKSLLIHARYCLKCWLLTAMQALHLVWIACVAAKH